MYPKKFRHISFTFLSGICAALFLAVGASAAEQTGNWQQNGKQRYYVYEDQTTAVGTVTIDGVAYLFAPNGVQQIGWQDVDGIRRYYDPETGDSATGFLQWRGGEYYIDSKLGKQTGMFTVDDKTYLSDASGVLQQDSWCKITDAWYYGSTDGTPAQGETLIQGKPYLFSEDYKLLTGWQTASDGITRRYEISSDGTPVIQTGWLVIEDDTYYADEENGMLCGIQTIQEQTYLFDENGIMQTGFHLLGDKTILLAADGVMQTGWITLEQQTYYADADGTILTGLQTIENNLYAFDETGVMLTGWQSIAEQKYYFDTQGNALLGLQQIGEDTYYFDDTGVMQVGSVDANGILCFLDADGRRIDGFHMTEAGKTYVSPLTGEITTGWAAIGTEQYYFDENGIAATGIITLDGLNYRFTDDGVYDPVKICLDAGHYAKYNRSPVNPTYYESDFNWKLHNYLKDELEQYNITVITTREDKDTDLSLAARGGTAKDCDLFLSLHSNACANPATDAPLACCTVTGSCDQLGLDLANLVADVMETTQRGTIWKRYSDDHPNQDYYGVLRSATAVNTPAILLEHSYHTNLRATNWLLIDENVRKLAAAEGEFLAKHFGMYPKKHSQYQSHNYKAPFRILHTGTVLFLLARMG